MTDDERRDEDDAPEIDPVARWGDPEERWGDPEKRWGDPEKRWGNPEVDLPNVPRVDIPGEDSDSDDDPEFTADINPEQSRMFWASVILANVGVAGITVGPMLIYFQGETLVGGGATLLGVLALTRVYSLYREYQAHDWSSDEDSDDGEGNNSSEKSSGDDDANDDTNDDADERNR
ncbi:hypothetical protein C453_06481 [Haloferax elongans ATCC BAA-1513]|uniref:DUF7322 domain-containing protein n=1 Tax=Haloferax elongans ATCC BAA-1513 TaxID=1230453 RepID=M0HPX0_HALEO|nr:hypothetical protein [Haloferax elongans]ELZ86526.1 hypothetical protein C453_06481 [Haloferax elongans ATCC BAA-1513]